MSSGKNDRGASSDVTTPGVAFVDPQVREQHNRIPFLKQPKLLKGNMEQVQKKTFSSLQTGITLGNSSGGGGGSFTLVNQIIKGSADGTRVGRRINMLLLRVKASLAPNASGGLSSTADELGQYAVVYDRNPNAAACTFGTIWQDVFAGTTRTCLTPENPDYEGRFLVLKRTPLILPYYTVTAGIVSNLTWRDNIKMSCLIDFKINLKELVSVYNSTNGTTVASINTGALYICLSGGPSAKWSVPVLGWQLTYADV